MIQQAIRKLVEGVTLTEEEASTVAEEIMTGEATQAQIGAFLVALRMNVESVAEITGMAKVMRAKALRVPTDGEVVDVVGTGGDGMRTFNISTASALVAAAAGVKVAKHGNRAASGVYGAADMLEAKGVKLELSADAVKRCIDEVGIGFMFAPAFHPALRHAGPVRREIGVRTVFNILGPLTNPAGAKYQVVGVGQPNIVMHRPQPELGELMANVLMALGTTHSWVVRGDDGLDELTTTDASRVWEVKNGHVNEFKVRPEEVGLQRARLSDLQADSAEGYAALFDQALGGESCPARDIVTLNAGAALVVGGKASTLGDGVALAAAVIDSGAPVAKLRQLAELSQRLA